MAPLDRILVTSDLSPPADRALARAVQLAAQHGAALKALYVVDHVLGADAPPEQLVKLLIGDAGEVVPALKRRAEQALRAKLGAQPPAQTEVAVRVGSAFLEIIRQARDDASDLIVLGAHGRHFLRKWVLGTTAERVVRKGDRPVLVVKKSPRRPYRRLLAAMDFSDTAKRALGTAMRVAPQAHVTLLKVYDLMEMALPAIDRVTSEELSRLQGEFANEQRARLGALAGELGLDPARVTNLVRYGHPGWIVNLVAAETRADLVVIGTRGLTGLPHLLLGSVAEHVLRESRCDVLVERPAVREFELP